MEALDVDRLLAGASVSAAARATIARELRTVAAHARDAGMPRHAVELRRLAAAIARMDGLHAAAAEDLRAALADELDLAGRAALQQELAECASDGGLEEAAELWGRVLHAAARSGDDDAWACALYHRYWALRTDAELHRLEQAAQLAPGTSGWSARAAASAATMRGDYQAARAHDEHALALARDAGDLRLAATCLDKLAVQHANTGDLQRALPLLEQAIELATFCGMHETAIVGLLTASDMYHDELDTQRQHDCALEAVRLARASGRLDLEPVATSFALVARAQLGDARGAAAEALGIAQRASNDPADPYAVAAVRQAALAALEHGDVAHATGLVERAVQRTTAFGYPSFIAEAHGDEIRLAALAGDLPRALALAARYQPGEQATAARIGLWLARLAVREESADAARIAHRLVSEAEGDGACAMARACIEEAHALLDADIDVERRTRIIEAWEAGGRRLDALRARLAFGQLLVRAGERSEGTALVETAWKGLADAGARDDADRARVTLRDLGVVRRAAGTASGSPLTPRERDVAVLLAAGYPNSRIAAHLHVSISTVERHVTNMLRKADAGSRVQLATWLDSVLGDGRAPVAAGVGR